MALILDTLSWVYLNKMCLPVLPCSSKIATNCSRSSHTSQICKKYHSSSVQLQLKWLLINSQDHPGPAFLLRHMILDWKQTPKSGWASQLLFYNVSPPGWWVPSQWYPRHRRVRLSSYRQSWLSPSSFYCWINFLSKIQDHRFTPGIKNGQNGILKVFLCSSSRIGQLRNHKAWNLFPLLTSSSCFISTLKNFNNRLTLHIRGEKRLRKFSNPIESISQWFFVVRLKYVFDIGRQTIPNKHRL